MWWLTESFLSDHGSEIPRQWIWLPHTYMFVLFLIPNVLFRSLHHNGLATEWSVALGSRCRHSVLTHVSQPRGGSIDLVSDYHAIDRNYKYLRLLILVLIGSLETAAQKSSRYGKWWSDGRFAPKQHAFNPFSKRPDLASLNENPPHDYPRTCAFIFVRTVWIFFSLFLLQKESVSVSFSVPKYQVVR
jgi:hypothetical protein